MKTWTPKDMIRAVNAAAGCNATLKHVEMRRNKNLLKPVNNEIKPGESYKYDPHNALLYVASTYLEHKADLSMDKAFNFMQYTLEIGLHKDVDPSNPLWLVSVNNGQAIIRERSNDPLAEKVYQIAPERYYKATPLPDTTLLIAKNNFDDISEEIISISFWNATEILFKAMKYLKMSELEFDYLVAASNKTEQDIMNDLKKKFGIIGR